MKIKSIFLVFFVIAGAMFFSSDLYAVPFKDMDSGLVDGCVGCRYYSTIFDAMSQGGHRVYTGLFNVCMFFLVVLFAFQMMKKIFKIVVTDMTQMESKSISNLDDFWRDTFKMVLKSAFVIGLVFTTEPQAVTRWTIDPIVSGGIAVSRAFTNYGIDQMRTSFGTSEATMNQQLVPSDVVPKIDLGIFQIPLYDIDTPMARSEYCANGARMKADADRYEQQDRANRLPNALPVLTKLDLLCLIQDVSTLSARYAGLATFYALNTFNAEKIIYVSKSDPSANIITFSSLDEKQAEDAENKMLNTFSSGSDFVYVVLTVMFVIWLIMLGFSIHGLISWLQLGTLVTLVITIGVPAVLLLLYFLLGGPAFVMTVMYFIIYIILRILMPFYFIQPIFHIAIILFALPLIATAWATGHKGYLNNAVDTLVKAAIGMAVLCLLFLLCVFFNEVTFYALYGNWKAIAPIYEAAEGGSELLPVMSLYNFLIMLMMNMFALYMMSRYTSVVNTLFGGEIGNDFFAFARKLFNDFAGKFTSVSKSVVGKAKEKKT